MAEGRTARAAVLTQALTGVLSNAEAARQLGLSVRQVRRLKGALARGGPVALAHGNRGRRSPRRLPDELRTRVAELARTSYVGQTHARLHELLAAREGIVLSRSTLRRVLLEAGLSSPYHRRPPRLPAGTLPVALDLGRRRVTFQDLQGADFRELSFQLTAERWRRERPDALRFELDLDVFMAAARLDPGRHPDGFVFSVGPYDGTQLAGMLSVPPEHLVIREAPVVNGLLMGLFGAGGEARRRELEALVGLALPFMFRPTRGSERHLLFKLSSWNLRAADTLLRLFPATPAAVVYRPAAATVAGMLARPPGWQDLLGQPRTAQARFFPSLAAVPAGAPLSPVAFYAHTWKSGIEQALALPGERVLLVEQAELAANPTAAAERVLGHFDLRRDASAIAAIVGARPSALRDQAARAPILDGEQAAQLAAVVGDLPARVALARDAQQRTGSAS